MISGSYSSIIMRFDILLQYLRVLVREVSAVLLEVLYIIVLFFLEVFLELHLRHVKGYLFSIKGWRGRAHASKTYSLLLFEGAEVLEHEFRDLDGWCRLVFTLMQLFEASPT